MTKKFLRRKQPIVYKTNVNFKGEHLNRRTMKKLLTLALFFSYFLLFAQIGDSDYEKGYVQGYYSVAKKQPAAIPPRANWGSGNFIEQSRSADPATQGNHEKTYSRKAFAEGFEKGKRDGTADIQTEPNSRNAASESRKTSKSKRSKSEN